MDINGAVRQDPEALHGRYFAEGGHNHQQHREAQNVLGVSVWPRRMKVVAMVYHIL